jgi:hypothetical protein
MPKRRQSQSSTLKSLRSVRGFVRLAGVDEAGATEALSFIPSEGAVMEQVVKLVDFDGSPGERK